MRFLIFIVILLAAGPGVRAQLSILDRAPLHSETLSAIGEEKLLQNKWSFGSFAALNTGIMSWRGGVASLSSVAVGLQAYRPVAHNLYAFGSISVAPTYVHFNNAFLNPVKGGLADFYSAPGNLGLSSRAAVGLMYVNEEKTFSISGSIGVERRNFPVYSSPLHQNSSPLINRW